MTVIGAIAHTSPNLLRFTRNFSKAKLPENLKDLVVITAEKEAKSLAPELSSTVKTGKKLGAQLKELPKKARDGFVNTAKGVFDKGFYDKYIVSDEKLLAILKSNSKKENLKFYGELGKLSLILSGLVVAFALPLPATGTLYAAAIPKGRQLASKFGKLLTKVR